MAEYQLAERIVVSRDILHGKPRIAGTRIPVSQILDMLGAGKSVTDIISDDYYPDLSAEDVMACLRYASTVIKAEKIIPSR